MTFFKPKHSKSSSALQKLKTFKGNKPDNPVLLDITNAEIVRIPQQKFEKDSFPYENVKQDWSFYWKAYNKGCSYYRRKWYQKAKEEFLKIYDFYHSSNAYHTYLVRTYRKIVDKHMDKKKYKEAFSEMAEMFDKCRNTTNSDIRKYNKVVKLRKEIDLSVEIMQKQVIVDIEPEFTIDSTFIGYLSECKRPRGFKLPDNDKTTILKLKEQSDFIPTSLPHIFFDSSKVEYRTLKDLPYLGHDVYRFRESKSRDAFMVCSKDLYLYLYDWELNLLHSFDASKYSPKYTHLRRVDLASTLSYFFFTNVDKAYLLDSNFEIISSWQVPHKEGWEKRKREPSSSQSNAEVRKYQNVLGLDNNPSREEIKSSFRRLALRHHPDKNPGDATAESRMKHIIEAYEYLTSDEAKNAFKGLEDEEYWVRTIDVIKFEVSGMVVEMSFSIGGIGEDWIYGSGISDDATRIFLGCYSGKTYQINRNGEVKKVYVTPERENGINSRTSPVSNIVERGDYLHILTYWYLYILKDDMAIKCLKVDAGKVKWFDSGFIKPEKKCIKVYLDNGDFLGALNFKDSIRHICHHDKTLLVETSKKSFIFQLNINAH